MRPVDRGTQPDVAVDPAEAYSSYLNPSLPTSERVENLLRQMTIAEKVGQMTQLDITLINTTGKQKDVLLDPMKARYYITKYHIGSFLNGEATSAGNWLNFTRELARIAVEESRLGIPVIYGIDHIHGASYLDDATIFPHAINLGATFNPKHAWNTGAVTALESAGLGHHWTFAPVLDLGVNPLWPRFYETYGEDPFMAAQMGASYVDGLQNGNRSDRPPMAATGKHFLGYSDPRTGWDRTPANLSPQQIQEFHRPAFQKAIDAGLKTIMLNSGEINGVPVHASAEIIQDLLRNQMGFDGVVVTDWDDVGKLVDFHFTAPTFKEATYDAVKAGIDICMTPLHLRFNTCMMELISEGRISEERIDESVRRVLKLKFELGLFENPLPEPQAPSRVGLSQNRDKARAAAEESIVLLKNDDTVLPISKPRRIGVFGPSANSKKNLAGGWTIAWQGGDESRYPEEIRTIYTALIDEYPGAEVHLFEESDLPHPDTATRSEHEAFLDRINALDVLIYAGGEKPYTEFAGNISDLSLPAGQARDIGLLSQSDTPLVLVLIQGRPRLITDVTEKTDALIHAGLPGFEGARAVAGVISGRINPSGKLPFSYPMHPNIHLPYNHKPSNLYFFDAGRANHIVQGNESVSLYPFGYGLSYTSFKYSRLRVSATTLHPNEKLTASVYVTNTGDKPGWETILWYTSTAYGKITRPVRELKHFERVYLKPGETSECVFTLDRSTISYPDANGNPVTERGPHTIIVGGHKAAFKMADGGL